MERWPDPFARKMGHRRDKEGEVIKEVVLNGPFVNGLASRMELRAFKPASYRLKMTLLQAFP